MPPARLGELAVPAVHGHVIGGVRRARGVSNSQRVGTRGRHWHGIETDEAVSEPIVFFFFFFFFFFFARLEPTYCLGGVGTDVLQEVNPDLIVIRVSGLGQSGPHAERPGLGASAEREAARSRDGRARRAAHAAGVPGGRHHHWADGRALVPGGCAGRSSEDEPGKAAVVEVSLYESLTFFLTPLLLEYQMTGEPPRRGNRAFGAMPRNTACCADGEWVAYSVQSPGLVTKLLAVIGAQTDDRFNDPAQLAHNGDAHLDRLLVAWIAEHGRSQVLSELADAGVPVAR